MDKKGQLNLGIILTAFIILIVGLALFLAIAQTVGESTNTLTYNSTALGTAGRITFPAAGASIDLTGQELESTPTVVFSNGTLCGADNYTITEGISNTTGVKTILFTTLDNAGAIANVSYVYGPDGYIESGASRSIAGLIAIFFALAIAVIALEPTMRSGVLNMMGK